jgi:kinesin family member 5
MMGPDGGKDIDNPDMKGIVPRMINAIFDIVGEAPEELEFMVKVSYIEIYMERIRDLLDNSKTNLRVRESKQKGVWVDGCTEVYVAEPSDVLEVLKLGSSSRATASTKMNAESSRSHSVFVLTVMQKNTKSDSTMNGKLYFVDLAGSEKVGKTGASGQTLEEAKQINKSLSALGNVINALTDGKSKHIPYRDSKLTRVLQESLGGNSRTTLVINCSPSSYNSQETVSTLRFGNRAKSIKNSAKVNEEKSAAELQIMLDKAGSEIEQLRIYIAGLEEELYALRGDTPTIVPSGGFMKRPSALLDGPSQSMPNVSSYASSSSYKPVPSSTSSAADASSPDSLVVPVAQSPSSHRRSASVNLEQKAPPAAAMPGKSVAKVHEQMERIAAELCGAQEENAALVAEQDRLRDELDEKRSQLEERSDEFEALSQSLAAARSAEAELSEQNKLLIHQIAELEISNERVEFAASEKQLTIEGLSEQNVSLERQLEAVQAKLNEAREARDNEALRDEERARRRQEKTDAMTRDLEALVGGTQPAAAVAATDAEQLAALRQDSEALQSRFAELERENAEQREHIEQMRRQAGSDATDGNSGVSVDGAALDAAVSRYERLKAETERKFGEFERLKTALLRDLQDRCEKVIDLEMLLDETRRQYEELSAKANYKGLLKKTAFLEKNLELLTNAHHELVSHSNRLRLENQIAQKKLAVRDERIEKIEKLATAAEDRQQQQQAESQATIRELREQIATLKRQLATRHQSPKFSRVARPVRGGGGAARSDDAKKSSFWTMFRSQKAEAAAASSSSSTTPSSTLSTQPKKIVRRKP